jgi:NAD(P)-dependent dehydrogenase (short-subunit alcohol dehydrogenase family)
MSENSFSIEGRIALVTGASSGIGHALAIGLAKAGANIVAAARRVDRLEVLVKEIEQLGGKALAVEMDVTHTDSIKKAFEKAEKELGICDIIVNNAGVADPKNFLDIDEESLDWVMNTNFRGVWHVAQEGAKRMAAGKKPGSIVNVASILALNAHSGQSSYSSSKGAVVQLTKSLAHDLGRYQIRVNAIAPGWFNTEMNKQFFETDKGKAYIESTPARRFGKLEELVGPVVFLVSDAGSFVNGVILPVDGAHSTQLV